MITKRPTSIGHSLFAVSGHQMGLNGGLGFDSKWRLKGIDTVKDFAVNACCKDASSAVFDNVTVIN